MELFKKKPSKLQKTVRVPLHLNAWLESKAGPAEISVPAAIVQIIEHAYQRDTQSVKRAK